MAGPEQCGYNVAQFVILSLVKYVLPCVSPCPILRAEKRSYGVVEAPTTFGFRSEVAQLPSKAPPALREVMTMQMTVASDQPGGQDGNQL